MSAEFFLWTGLVMVVLSLLGVVFRSWLSERRHERLIRAALRAAGLVIRK